MHVGRFVVFDDAIAKVVGNAQIILSVGVSLLCGLQSFGIYSCGVIDRDACGGQKSKASNREAQMMTA
jgi:hypothetical protein|tara:strand:+ start:3663 stop:3866 length:204 start_codon:yes stop_codon:yes gene_type:complete